MNRATLGIVLRARRKAKRLTLLQLARKVNLSKETIRLAEVGQVRPRLENMVAICRALGATVDEIVTEAQRL